MRFSSPLGLGLSVLALLAFVPPTQAQSRPAPVDEGLFALYVLDWMYMDPLPNPPPNDPMGVLYDQQLGAFVAHHRLAYDTMRRYYERRRLDPDIFALYRAHEPVLDLWKGFNDKRTTARLAYDREMSFRQMQAANAMAGASLFFAMNLLEGGSSRDILASLLYAQRVAAVERARLTVLQQRANERYWATLLEAGKEYFPKIKKMRDEKYLAFKQAVAELRDKHGWQDAQIHEPTAEDTANPDVPRNLFYIVKSGRNVLAKESASREELLEQATACQRAAEMVPTGKPYDLFRSTFLAAAGHLANRAALKDLGTVGFSSAIKNPPQAGPVALKIWGRYLRSAGEVNDAMIHQFIIACGCAGKPIGAFQLVVKNAFQQDRLSRPVVNPRFSFDPAFWYDAARIASLVREHAVAMQCLQQAVRAGFRDYEAAKIDPDLKSLREDPTTARQFQALIR
jgi:hypothetical protein